MIQIQRRVQTGLTGVALPHAGRAGRDAQLADALPGEVAVGAGAVASAVQQGEAGLAEDAGVYRWGAGLAAGFTGSTGEGVQRGQGAG